MGQVACQSLIPLGMKRKLPVVLTRLILAVLAAGLVFIACTSAEESCKEKGEYWGLRWNVEEGDCYVQVSGEWWPASRYQEYCNQFYTRDFCSP